MVVVAAEAQGLFAALADLVHVGKAELDWDSAVAQVQELVRCEHAKLDPCQAVTQVLVHVGQAERSLGCAVAQAQKLIHSGLAKQSQDQAVALA